jgi:7,8-dihydroneopterin aldolase/epimerase/oxygenase
MTADRISIRGLRVATHVGVTDEERATSQIVVLDVDVVVDLTAASTSDDLSDTVDYGTLTTRIWELVQGHESRLLESLAGSVAQLVLEVAGVEQVLVRVAKESPPVKEALDSVSVRIERP